MSNHRLHADPANSAGPVRRNVRHTKMEYTTNLKIKEVVDILVEQIDPIPSNL
jgi:hypothetical protein